VALALARRIGRGRCCRKRLAMVCHRRDSDQRYRCERPLCAA
jgi:hypothetical protein